jgi:hypothetical protein
MQNDSGTILPTSEQPLGTPLDGASSGSYTPPPPPAPLASSLEPVGDTTPTPPPSETVADLSSSTLSGGLPNSNQAPSPPKPSAAKKAAKKAGKQKPGATEDDAPTPPRPERDPVHGTDTPEWYLWMAENADDAEFFGTYRSRRASINAKELGPEFENFLDRLNGIDPADLSDADLLKTAADLLGEVTSEQSDEWSTRLEEFQNSYALRLENA